MSAKPTTKGADAEALALYICHEALAVPDLTPDGRRRICDCLSARFGPEGQLIAYLKAADTLVREAIRSGRLSKDLQEQVVGRGGASLLALEDLVTAAKKKPGKTP